MTKVRQAMCKGITLGAPCRWWAGRPCPIHDTNSAGVDVYIEVVDQEDANKLVEEIPADTTPASRKFNN